MTFVAAAVIGGATVLGSVISSRAAGQASRAQTDAAGQAAELQYQVAQDQIKAQRETLDKQLAAQGGYLDKQLAAQYDTLEKQLAFQQRMYDQTRADFAPYRESGVANLNQLNTLLGIGGNTGAADFGRYKTAEFTPEAFLANKDPGYGFRFSEGQKAVDRQAAARGGLISGAALKASQRFGQDMASQEYGNAFNRYQTVRGNTLQPFQVGAAAGQSAAAMQGQANANFGGAGSQAYGALGSGLYNAYGSASQGATNAYGALGTGTYNALGGYGAGASEALTGAGNARASGYVGQANAITGGISNLSNQYYQNQLLSAFANRSDVPALPTNYYGTLGNPYGYGSWTPGGSPN
jgi:hypothetical protein